MQGSAFPYLLFSNNSSILPRSPDLSSPKFCLGVDGVQRLGHALPSKPLFVRGFFVYMIKMSQKERFSLFAHIPSSQLVTKLPNSNKGGVKGHVLISGPWVVCMRGRTLFHPRCSL